MATKSKTVGKTTTNLEKGTVVQNNNLQATFKLVGYGKTTKAGNILVNIDGVTYIISTSTDKARAYAAYKFNTYEPDYIVQEIISRPELQAQHAAELPRKEVK